ncbi:MAG: replicative DNA helicase [Planctomycetota bacterium]|nr:MAG: replicative DNA helicase [Planctomycetota bacterium]
MPEESFDELISPRDLDAERAVLGAMVLENDTIDEIVGIVKLRADDFFDPHHQTLFTTIITLRDRIKVVDVLTLKNELEKEDPDDDVKKWEERPKKSLLEQVGGTAYLAEILDSSPHAANAAHHATIVRNLAVQRRIIKVGKDIIEKAKRPPGSAEDVLEYAEKSVLEISREHESEIVQIKDVVYRVFRDLEHLHKDGRERTGLLTGTRFQRLDEITNGFSPGHLIVLAARPGVGKTTLALNFMQEIGVTRSHRIAMFSLEMDQNALVERLLADKAKVNATHIKTGRISSEELNRLQEVTAEIYKAEIYIDDTSYLTPMDVRRKARRLKNQHDIEMIIIDYLQLMSAKDRTVSSRQEEIANITRSLKNLAKELSIPILAIAQLRRSAEDRDERGPRMSDLRESGAIEQDADIVMLLHRLETEGNFALYVAKNRHGRIGTRNLYFVAEHLSFEELARDDRPGFVDGGDFDAGAGGAGNEEQPF